MNHSNVNQNDETSNAFDTTVDTLHIAKGHRRSSLWRRSNRAAGRHSLSDGVGVGQKRVLRLRGISMLDRFLNTRRVLAHLQHRQC